MSVQAKKVQPPSMHLVSSHRFETYGKPGWKTALLRDVMAGLIVSLVAIPLGIGFAIASGLKPEQGVMAGAVAGILGGLFGGSKYQVYGPTAAFIPLLSGIVARYDVPFLLLASMIAGAVIILMGFLKLGDLFSKIPFSIIVGFTIGIALSIAVGQMPDALGSLQPSPIHMLEKMQRVGALLMHPNLQVLCLAMLSFFITKTCYQISVFIPGPLIAILVAILIVAALEQVAPSLVTVPLVSDKFGLMGQNIFKVTLPALGPYHSAELLMPVLSIVFIASLESLLSARMADRLANSKTPFSPNQELIGQGIVNAVAPLLNGFPCTGAFARTATNIKAGAISPAASIFQGFFIVILVVFLGRWIGMIPLACISGLLLYVAFNMVKMEEVRHIFREGKLSTLLMGYTAIVTLLTDLFMAVTSASVLYYLATCRDGFCVRVFKKAF